MPKPETHYFDVELIIPSSRKGEAINLVMPVWTPGSYLVREFSRNVLEFGATRVDSGEELRSYKTSKNSWRVEDGSESSIRISYRVHAFEFTVDTSYLDTRHGIINGASVFMYVEGRDNEGIALTVVPHPDWKVVATSLDPLEEKVGRSKELYAKVYASQNFDILVDSPIEIGNQEMREFEVNGIHHEVSMFGPRPIDEGKFVSDLKRIVEAEAKVFDFIPYKRYLFIVDFGGSATGGLEHLSSTHCIMPRLRLIPEGEYKVSLSLFSHELFHAWNVKRMRPAGLGPFNYSSETYTKSLWIAEGITSYYDDYILRRAGIFSVGEYLDAFSDPIGQLKFLPAQRYESAEESSFDSWVKHYRQNENSQNIHCSYYVQGSIIGWMIDLVIRKSTHGEKCLDHAMRRLYNDTYVKENRGYTEGEFEKICNEVAGKNLSDEIFGARVRGHAKYDFDLYLGYAGLRLGTKSEKGKGRGYLGIKLRSEAGGVFVQSKLFSTPAEKCGLASGDEIIAVDNLRMDQTMFRFYISNKKPGERISILISRDGYLETLNSTLIESPQTDIRIFKKDQATAEEKSLFKNWMIADWDSDIDYPEYTPSPARPKLIDYI